MIERFSDKDPLEALILSVDFANILGAATIITPGWAITREDLTTEDTAGMKSGAVAVAGTVVSQKVINGVVGGSYIHRVSVVDSTGRTLIQGVRQNVTFGA